MTRSAGRKRYTEMVSFELSKNEKLITFYVLRLHD